MNSIKIALLDAEPTSAAGLSASLHAAGIAALCFSHPAHLYRELQRAVFDVVLVSDNLPGTPATGVVQMLKRAVICQAPVLIIAHRTSRLNLIDAFDAGADDYVRANDTGSLLSRVIGHHRRARRRDGSVRHIGIGAYILDLDGHCAMLGDMTIHLTPKEFALARLMFSSPMITLPREHIETVVWGSTRPPLSRALAAMVARLRRVLQLRPEHGLTLTGVHAFGYRLDVHGLDAPGPAQDRAVRAQEPHRAA